MPIEGRHWSRAAWKLAIALLATALSPSPARAETLQDALIAAYGDNAQLQTERAQLRATDDYVPQALANWRPTVSVNAYQGVSHNATRQDCGKVPQSVFGTNCAYSALNNFSNLWPQSYGLTITQPIFRGGRTVAQTEQALDQVRAERANLVTVEETVFVTVATDYMNVVLEDTLVDLGTAYAQRLRALLVGTRERWRDGELTRADVAEAASAYAQALSTRRASESQLAQARAAFEHDVGRPAGKLVAPRDVPELPSSRQDADDLAAMANPAVVSAQFTQAAAEDNVRLIKGQFLPTLDLQASISRAKENTGQSGLRTDNGQVLAQLTVPLYQGGAVSADMRQAEEVVGIRKGQVDDARRAAVQAADQAFEQRDAARDLVELLGDQIRVNEVALEGIKREAAAGDRTVYDILVQEETLFQSEESLVQAQHDQRVAEFTLAQATGRLTAKSLGLPVVYYDPDRYFEAVRVPDGPIDGVFGPDDPPPQ